MPVEKDAAVTLGWCDNGHVDGKFAEKLMAAVLSGAENGTPLCESIRVHGNQIGRQRQMGEDVVFFRRLKAAGVPLHAHTGAVVKHVKRFGLDRDRAYYELYWSHPSTATAPRPVRACVHRRRTSQGP